MDIEKTEDLIKKANFNDRRSLAIEFNTSEEQIEKALSKHGFQTLERFSEDQTNKISIDLNYTLEDLEKRKLQGLFGEKVAIFIKGRIKEFLKESLEDDWSLREGVKLKTEESSQSKSMWYGQKQIGEGFQMTDSTIRHRNMDEDEIKKKVRENHFITSKELFNEFSNHQIPSIDQVYYGLKFSGHEKPRTYHLMNTASSSFSRQNKEKINLRHVEDFKIIGLEIKTTENKAENLFSNLQRSVRDKAISSPFLDLYSLKVEYDIESEKVPDSVDLRIEKCHNY